MDSMIWCIGLASFFLLCTSLATAHEPVLLDARRATPGLLLEIIELPATITSATARYRLRVSRLPRDVVFGVWAKDFGHSFHEVATGFRMDASGAMVSSELDVAGWVWRWWHVRDHRVATRGRLKSWRLASRAPCAFSCGSGLISPIKMSIRL